MGRNFVRSIELGQGKTLKRYSSYWGFNFLCAMDRIRRKIFHKMYKNKSVTKALALAIFVKNRIKSSTIQDFSYNKLHLITGLHINTLKKRLDVLKRMGLVEFIGTHKQHLCFKSIVSSCDHRNVSIKYGEFDTIKDIEMTLFAYLLVEIQRRKDFAKHTIQTARNGRDLEQIKAARRTCRRNGYSEEYQEWGLSYKGIAKRLGVGVQKAFFVVKFAIEQGLVTKIKRQLQKFVKGVGAMQKSIDSNFTFCTKDNEYYILANAYALTPKTMAWQY